MPTGMWVGIILLLTLIGLVVFILLTIALIRLFIHNAALARQKQLEYKEKYQSDGTPYPAASRGLCDNCQRLHEKVYFLPSGSRLCPECYQGRRQS